MSSWTKYPEPVFQAANGDYGPGHNYFFLVRLVCTSIPAHLLTCDPSVSQRQSGLERAYFHMMQYELHADCYQVYHASPTSTVACDGTRRTFVQQVTFDSSGNPVLGTPVAPGKAINEPV